MADLLKDLMSQVKSAEAAKSQPAPQQEESPEQIAEFIEKLNNLTRAIRTLEERYNNLRRRTQLTDHNILVQHQRLNKELRLNDSDLIDIKRDLQKLNDKINMLEKELDMCAKKQELDIQAKYIEYWRPLNFLTLADAERIIKAALVENGIDTTEKEEPPIIPKRERSKPGERSVY